MMVVYLKMVTTELYCLNNCTSNTVGPIEIIAKVTLGFADKTAHGLRPARRLTRVRVKSSLHRTSFLPFQRVNYVGRIMSYCNQD